MHAYGSLALYRTLRLNHQGLWVATIWRGQYILEDSPPFTTKPEAEAWAIGVLEERLEATREDD